MYLHVGGGFFRQRCSSIFGASSLRGDVAGGWLLEPYDRRTSWQSCLCGRSTQKPAAWRARCRNWRRSNTESTPSSHKLRRKVPPRRFCKRIVMQSGNGKTLYLSCRNLFQTGDGAANAVPGGTNSAPRLSRNSNAGLPAAVGLNNRAD